MVTAAGRTNYNPAPAVSRIRRRGTASSRPGREEHRPRRRCWRRTTLPKYRATRVLKKGFVIAQTQRPGTVLPAAPDRPVVNGKQLLLKRTDPNRSAVGAVAVTVHYVQESALRARADDDDLLARERDGPRFSARAARG
jgi:hypothetical protein